MRGSSSVFIGASSPKQPAKGNNNMSTVRNQAWARMVMRAGWGIMTFRY